MKTTTTDTPTTRPPLAERITQGPIHRFQRTITGIHGFPICDVRNDEMTDDEMRDNAELIAQAFNVAHETGRTPRQLATERAELIAALRKVLGQGGFVNLTHLEEVDQLLTRLQS